MRNLNWGKLHPAPFAKSEADNVYQATKTGKVQLVLLARHGTGSLGLRLVTCKSKKDLTGWKQMKKTKMRYTLDKKVKKRTCFRVQSGRSWVNSAPGHVRGNVKWLKIP
ncbi:hypothetical protein NE236_01175 [Actinoallomurus purpureus]|uniref:hypothetical protein n=1 Tax=Actinoallomurus purpureus TaxID=478114 RepID=UPI002093113F|nr:hypothetical protein [Actinoallomurus purpureus]MCO6003583.1 hypothetical protein [Actinoallomurus purpureus]